MKQSTRCRWLATMGPILGGPGLLFVASFLHAQDTRGHRDPLPPIISTRDPEVVPAAFQPPPAPEALPAPAPVFSGPPKDPSPLPGERPLPINLPTAMRLANVRPIDIAVAQQRVAQAGAQLDLTRYLWLPTIYIGSDYFRHDGQIQSSAGEISGNSHSAFMAGAGPSMVFAVTDAYFAPLAARQVVAAQRANVQAAANDSMLAVAEAYFSVQQARGELAGAEDAVTRAVELSRRAEELAKTLASPAEATRARAELARRRQAVQLARERWRTASAELARLLRLDPSALVDPQEPPQLQVALVPLDMPVEDLIPIALTNRPELAAQQALVQAALERLKQEKLRPFLPSVVLRGGSTTPSGTLAVGAFGGGTNDSINNFSARSDFDIQVLWELQYLGFGNRARVKAQESQHQIAIFESFRVQDQVAAEVVQAHAQAVSALQRAKDAEDGLKDALDSAEKNLQGLGETKRAGNLVLLVVRPQEAVASVQALAAAYTDYYDAVADFNRAQFRLYRALGHPANLVLGPDMGCGGPSEPRP